VPADKGFFREQREASAIKGDIVAKYLVAWGFVVAPRAGDRVVYFDPFAGPGRYEDGNKATPIVVLEAAAGHPQLKKKLISVFRDVSKEHCEALRKNIRDASGIDDLSHPPVVICEEADLGLASHFSQQDLRPTFAFLDPCGFKGVTLDLVNSLIKDWGCDCLFFFNYNEVNRWLAHEGVAIHIEALFGAARAERLRAEANGLRPAQREELVLGTLKAGLLAGPGEYVHSFRFMNTKGSRTSHYLVFVSKSFKGYEIMRDIMAKASSYKQGDVPTYVYTPRIPRPSLFDALILEDLKADLVREFAGQRLAVRELFERHSPGRRFILPNYKTVLRQLEAEGRVDAAPAADKRKRNTLGDDVVLIFPREAPN
jgi:three-Cys-motif partner protein